MDDAFIQFFVNNDNNDNNNNNKNTLKMNFGK